MRIAPHPLLDLHAFIATTATPLGGIQPSAVLEDAIAGSGLDLPTVPGLPAAVRDLLRHGGFRPSGRNRPASEYLARADQEGGFPRINVAVDAGNAVSRHGGLPVSVIDLDRTRGELRVEIAPSGTTYPFNPSGQTFDASGLLVLCDEEGVCATPVKDAQRTKTSADTTRVLCVLWGVAGHAGHGSRVASVICDLFGRLGLVVEPAP